MTASYYDVVVLGTELAPLTCGALLANRGFRVLAVGQESVPHSYPLGPHRLPRRPFTLLASNSPITRKVVGELGLSQSLRRLTSHLNPAFQIALPRHRISIPHGDEGLDAELERAFASVKRPTEEYFRLTRRFADELDAVLERDLVWPPETFFEKREFARAISDCSFDRDGEAPDLLGELPEDHPFRIASRLPMCFSGGMDPDRYNALRLTRTLHNRRTAAVDVNGGRDALHELLSDKIRAHGGALRPEERVGAIRLKRGGVTGVQMRGSDDEIGCAFVVVGVPVASLVRLLPDRAQFSELFERIGEPQLRYYRYTLNVILQERGIPQGMERDVFLVRDSKLPLSGENALHVQHTKLEQERALLCVQALLPAKAVEDLDGYMEGSRERVLDALRSLVPFLDQHLVAVDSPHDGREPMIADDSLTYRARDLGPRGPRTMSASHAYPVTSGLGLCAMPVRTPIRQLLLCNSQVVPGLGMEGRLLAGCTAAGIVSKADRSKEWMRRSLWTKVEI